MSWRPLDGTSRATLALAAAGDHRALGGTSSPQLTDTCRGQRRSSFASSQCSPSDDDALPETVESLLTSRIDTLAPGRPPAPPPRVGDRRLRSSLDLLAEILPDEAGDPERWGASRTSSTGTARRCFGSGTISCAPRPTTGSRSPGGARSTRSSVTRSSGGRSSRRLDADVAVAALPRSGDCDEGVAYADLAGDDARDEVREHRRRDVLRARARRGRALRLRPADELARVCEALGDVRELAARYDEAGDAYTRALDPTARARACCASVASSASAAGATTRHSSSTTIAATDADAAETVALSSPVRSSSTARARSTSPRRALRRRRKAPQRSTTGRRSLMRTTSALRPRATAAGQPATSSTARCAIFEELGLLHRQATVLNNLGVRAYYEGALGRGDRALPPRRGGRAARRRRAHRWACDEQPRRDPARPGSTWWRRPSCSSCAPHLPRAKFPIGEASC